MGLFYREPEDAGLPPQDFAAIRGRCASGRATRRPRPGSRSSPSPRPGRSSRGLTGIVYVTWLYVAWLPDYLESARHVSVAETGLLAAIPQVAGFIGGCLGGLVSDRLAHAGMDPADSRKYPTIVGLLLAGALTALVPFAPSTTWDLVLISAAMFFAYGAGSTSWALGATLTPPALSATLEAISNIGGSLGGASAPLVTGLIVEHTHSFALAFEMGAIASFAAAGCYFFVRSADYVQIGDRPGPQPSTAA